MRFTRIWIFSNFLRTQVTMTNPSITPSSSYGLLGKTRAQLDFEEDSSDANIVSEPGAGNTPMEVDLPTPAKAGTASAQAVPTETKDEGISEHLPIDKDREDADEKSAHAAEIDSPAKEGEKQKVKSGKKPKRAKAKETGDDKNADDEPNPPAKEVSPKSKTRTPADPDATEKSPAQLAFEEERDDILSQTPEHIKAVFGQMVLAGWSGKAYPALALSPFDVPPGSVREQWMTMFENVRTRAVSRAPT
jgi:hypothetical protein